VLESDASAWFPLSDLAEERAADWLASAVNIATAVLEAVWIASNVCFMRVAPLRQWSEPLSSQLPDLKTPY